MIEKKEVGEETVIIKGHEIPIAHIYKALPQLISPIGIVGVDDEERAIICLTGGEMIEASPEEWVAIREKMWFCEYRDCHRLWIKKPRRKGSKALYEPMRCVSCNREAWWNAGKKTRRK